MFPVTFYFGVLENTLSPGWTDLIYFFKDLLYTNFYKLVLPSSVSLENINIKVFSPKGQELVNKNLSFLERGDLFLERGDLDERLHRTSKMFYAYNLYSSVLIANRNQFQIRLPYIGIEKSEIDDESDIAEKLSASTKLLANNITYSPSTGNGEVIFRLLIFTNKRDAVSNFFPVDYLQAVGFVSPRVFKTRGDFNPTNNTSQTNEISEENEGGSP